MCLPSTLGISTGGHTLAQGGRDTQLTGLAGEFFVAAELLKRGLQASITLGNAKQIDLFAHNPRTGQTHTVQVKAIRDTNEFPIDLKRINAQHIYVFVLLNKPDVPVEYFIVPGQVLVDEPERFGKNVGHPTFPGIHPRYLRAFGSNWTLFGASGDG